MVAQVTHGETPNTPGGVESRQTERERTLAAPARISGVGLFTGRPATVTIKPADEGTGLRFRRTDLPGSPVVPAHIDHVWELPRRTGVRIGEAGIETIEHCLSALAGLGIDNAEIDIDAPEVPALDGSALAFVEAIEQAGIHEQARARVPIVITAPITVREGEAMIAAVPADHRTLDLMYVLDYGEGSPIERQSQSVLVDPTSYRRQIAPARTFSTRTEAEAARSRGLFAHLSPREMLVFDQGGPIDNTLRFSDEPVRHKLLDLLGDLALAGRPLRGRIVAMRSGHALNQRMARELADLSRTGAGDARPGGGAVSATVAPPAMDIRAIMRLLPHRYPMILVDRVLEIEGDKRAVGVKNVSINEPFFQGHYPGTPIMPGVLIVEAMCQLSGLMLAHKLERTGKIAVLLGLESVRLRRPVTPGDQLVLETESIRASARHGDVQARAFVAGQLVAEARVRFMMLDAEQAT